jgi:hypothetical protein
MNLNVDFPIPYKGLKTVGVGQFGEIFEVKDKCSVVGDPQELKHHLTIYLESIKKLDAARKGYESGTLSAQTHYVRCKESLTDNQKKLRSLICTERQMIEKRFRPDDPIFSDLAILNSIESDLLDFPGRGSQKWCLEAMFGFKIIFKVDDNGSSAAIRLRKLEPWKKNHKSQDDLISEADILKIFGLAHSDVKPSNIMSDGQVSWLTDIDNLIQGVASGGFAYDANFYRFRGTPSLEDRYLHDKSIIKSLCS